MSFPSNLPKPPPKLPPRAAPGSKPPGLAAPAAPAAFAAATPAAPAAAQMASQTAPQMAPQMAARPLAGPTAPAGASAAPLSPRIADSTEAVRPTPQVDTRGLAPILLPMIAAIQDYDGLLIEENACLRACDAKGVSALQERKQRATKIYQERLRELLGGGGRPMHGAPTEQRDKVMALIRCLEERCHENASLLKANMDATERVFEVVNNAVMEARRRDALYTKSGGINYGHNSSVAYNATI